MDGTKIVYYLKRVKSNHDEKNEIIPFKKEEVLIGRSFAAHHIIRSSLISRNHAIFSNKGSIWTVKNLSLNGVFINGEPVMNDAEKEIKVGSFVQFGQPDVYVYKFCSKKIRISNDAKCSISMENTSSRQGMNHLMEKQDVVNKKLQDNEIKLGALKREKQNLLFQKKEEHVRLENDFQSKKSELKRECAKVEQSLITAEKDHLQNIIDEKICVLQKRFDADKLQLESRYKEKETCKENVIMELRNVAEQLSAEKIFLEESLKQNKEELSSNKESLDKMKKEIEKKDAILKEAQEKSERCYAAQKEEAQLCQQEKEFLNNRLLELEDSILQKNLILCSMEVELKEQADIKKRMEEFRNEKEDLSVKLHEAELNKGKLKKLEKAVCSLEAEKMSLESAVASTSDANNEKSIVVSLSNIMESELQCSICNELFINGVNLTCSHTFCKFCIETWKKKKNQCPNCRAAIKIVAPSVVLDSFINKIVEALPEDEKKKRQNIVEERKATVSKATEVNAAKPSTSRRGSRGRRRGRGRNRRENDSVNAHDSIRVDPPSVPVVITSDSDTDYDDSYFSDSSIEGDPTEYYGGYGHCYNCGLRGHWANGCPDNW